MKHQVVNKPGKKIKPTQITNAFTKVRIFKSAGSLEAIVILLQLKNGINETLWKKFLLTKISQNHDQEPEYV